MTLEHVSRSNEETTCLLRVKKYPLLHEIMFAATNKGVSYVSSPAKTIPREILALAEVCAPQCSL